jgi:hypothetical protein
MDRFAIAPRKNAFSLPSKDQALLDSLVEASLAEVRALRPIPIEPCEGEVDPANRFFASAVAFLAKRPDRDELIERLREAVVVAPPRRAVSWSPADATPQPTNPAPEVGEVRKDV